MAEIETPKIETRSNSLTKKEVEVPEKTVGKIVTGSVRIKKKGIGRRLHDIFLADDFNTVKEYAIMDVIIPGIKNLIVDSISMLILGETRRKGDRKSGYVSYGSYSNRREDRDKDRERKSRRRSEFDLTDDIIFESRGDAEEVLDTLIEQIDRYGQATLSDFYDLAGVESSFTDERWGWVSLKDARIIRSGGGHIIDLPKPYPID